MWLQVVQTQNTLVQIQASMKTDLLSAVQSLQSQAQSFCTDYNQRYASERHLLQVGGANQISIQPALNLGDILIISLIMINAGARGWRAWPRLKPVSGCRVFRPSSISCGGSTPPAQVERSCSGCL